MNSGPSELAFVREERWRPSRVQEDNIVVFPKKAAPYEIDKSSHGSSSVDGIKQYSLSLRDEANSIQSF